MSTFCVVLQGAPVHLLISTFRDCFLYGWSLGAVHKYVRRATSGPHLSQLLGACKQHPPYLLIAHTIIVIILVASVSDSILIKILLPGIWQFGAVVL